MSEEHQDAAWVSYEEAKDYELKPGMGEVLDAMRQTLQHPLNNANSQTLEQR